MNANEPEAKEEAENKPNLHHLIPVLARLLAKRREKERQDKEQEAA